MPTAELAVAPHAARASAFRKETEFDGPQVVLIFIYNCIKQVNY